MKRTITLILSVLLVLLMCIQAGALTIFTYGDWVVTRINNNKEYEVYQYDGTDETAAMPDTTDGFPWTSIGSHVFSNNTTMKTFVAGKNLRTIGKYAFLNATAVERITLTPAVTQLSASSFFGTASLDTINLADTAVTMIPEYCFTNSGLSSVSLPETCTAIGEYAFARCGNLTKVEMPASVTEIAETAFDHSDKAVIYADSTSYAIEYAKERGIPYILTDISYYMVGDADEDEEINIFDVTCIQRILADFAVEDAERSAIRGDVNGDGLDIFDATTIQRYIAGMTIDDSVHLGEIAYYE